MWARLEGWKWWKSVVVAESSLGEKYLKLSGIYDTVLLIRCGCTSFILAHEPIDFIAFQSMKCM